jgi:Flp pilus assembly protein TadD
VRQVLVFFSAAMALSGAAGSSFDEARKFYRLSDFDQSLQILRSIPDRSAAVWELTGQNYFGQGDFKKATEAFEKAVSLEPSNSMMTLWLGRAYGRRAETSSPFTAPGYASKARQQFEKAVNLEAMSDLLEYYLEAPGFLGGGLDKAAAIAERMSAVNTVEGHWAQAKLAEKRKEFRSAESHLRKAVEAAPHQAGRLIDLARLFTRQGRLQEADQSIAKAEQLEPNSPKVIFAKAELYVQTKRNLEQARQLLKRYMSMTITPDDPPRSDAEKLLKQMGS